MNLLKKMINKISIPNRDSTKTGFYGKEFKLEWQRNGQYAQVGKIFIDYTSCGGDEFEETEDCNECACADYKQIYHQVFKLKTHIKWLISTISGNCF